VKSISTAFRLRDFVFILAKKGAFEKNYHKLSIRPRSKGLSCSFKRLYGDGILALMYIGNEDRVTELCRDIILKEASLLHNDKSILLLIDSKGYITSRNLDIGVPP